MCECVTTQPRAVDSTDTYSTVPTPPEQKRETKQQGGGVGKMTLYMNIRARSKSVCANVCVSFVRWMEEAVKERTQSRDSVKKRRRQM